MLGSLLKVLTRNDKILIAALVAISLLSAIPVVLALAGQSQGIRAVVFVAGQRVATLNLNESRFYDIKTAVGVEQLQVSKGRVRVLSTRCPRKICKHQGWVSLTGREIVCVPGRMVVRIEGGGTPDVDAISK